jgi:hypothetical protein
MKGMASEGGGGEDAAEEATVSDRVLEEDRGRVLEDGESDLILGLWKASESAKFLLK